MIKRVMVPQYVVGETTYKTYAEARYAFIMDRLKDVFNVNHSNSPVTIVEMVVKWDELYKIAAGLRKFEESI
jgi:hypothetical protein